MRKIEIDERRALKDFEKKILERQDLDFILPVTVAESEDGMQLLYLTDGYAPLNECELRDLGEVFRVARLFLTCLSAGRDRLLDTRGFFFDPGCVYVKCGANDVRLLFGDVREGKESDAHSVLPVLTTLAEFRRVLGAKSAIGRIIKRIRETEPGFAEMRKIVAFVEREWRYIQPDV
ncbi:MAG: DUF6382 domain-containing protein [Clostridiales Family XIII bacterium]|nr:DUF6382 domain-containing protein [Clostridiales Family XIII bacterium]